MYTNTAYDKLFFILFFLFLVSGCQGDSQDKKKLPADFFHKLEGINQNQLPDPRSEGAQLTAQYCSQCHGIPYPSGHSSSDWVVIMRQMILYMKQSNHMGSMGGMMGNGNMHMRMMGANVPSPEERNAILSYLQAHSMKSISENELPEVNGVAAKDFKSQCSVCHALPSPYQHTAEQWPAVVKRMLQHMKDFKLPVISENEADTIIKYLQKASVQQ